MFITTVLFLAFCLFVGYSGFSIEGILAGVVMLLCALTVLSMVFSLLR